MISATNMWEWVCYPLGQTNLAHSSFPHDSLYFPSVFTPFPLTPHPFPLTPHTLYPQPSAPLEYCLLYNYNNLLFTLLGRLTETKSIFCYPSGSSWSTYNDVTWVPTIFQPPFSTEQDRLDAVNVCGTNSACLMDIASTNDVTAGTTALTTNVDFVQTQTSLGWSTLYLYI